MRLKVYVGHRLVISHLTVAPADKLRKWTNKISHPLRSLSLLVRDVAFFTSAGRQIGPRTTFKDAFGDVQTGVLELHRKRK
jgi:hypothetical protein